ncbi:MAG TPA: HAD-IA family hydrolase [Gemmatimonadales bacterium]|nr:HAD-IA family hydrolase [Gemmatimonadales bacterium]
MTDFRTVLFDLDGTLIDSIALILASYHHTLAAHGHPPVPDADWLRGVGTPLRVQLAPWGSTPELLDALVTTYRAFNLEHHDRMVRAYPGLNQVVRAIHGSGRALGIVTSKGREGTLRGLRAVGLDGLIDVVISADDVDRPKPDPEPVRLAVERLEADPATTVYVGDSIHDLHAGRAAGVRTAAVLWGPFARTQLEPGAPDFWLERPDDLSRLILSSS